MPQSYCCLLYHVIFSTKERASSISPAVRPRLYEYIGGIVREEAGVLQAVGGTADHIHLLLSLSREQSVAAAVRLIKTNSSRWLHQLPHGDAAFAWQAGYAAFTIGHSGRERVRRYIEGQEEHHRTMTFDEELKRFLHEYEVSFDERYLRT